MRELRTISCVFCLATLIFLCYGAFMPGGAAVASPSVTITQPVHGALVQGTIAVGVAYRSTTGAPVTDLELYIDQEQVKAVKLKNPSSEGSYTFAWNTRGLDTGLHTIRAVAYDTKGQPGDVAVSIYVDPQQIGAASGTHTVTVTSPRGGEVLSGIVQITASVLDDSGVKMVMFFLNDRLLFGTNHPPFRCTWDTSRVPNGMYSIRVYAYDASENRGESVPLMVTVDNPSGRTLPNERLSGSAPGAAGEQPGRSGMRLQPQAGKVQAPETPASPRIARTSPETPVRSTRPQLAPLPLPPAAVSAAAAPAATTAPAGRTPGGQSTAGAPGVPDLEVVLKPAGQVRGTAVSASRARPAAARPARPSASAPRAPARVALRVDPQSKRFLDFIAGRATESTAPARDRPRPTISAPLAPVGSIRIAALARGSTVSIPFQAAGPSRMMQSPASGLPQVTMARLTPDQVVLAPVGGARSDSGFAAASVPSAATPPAGKERAQPVNPPILSLESSKALLKVAAATTAIARRELPAASEPRASAPAAPMMPLLDIGQPAFEPIIVAAGFAAPTISPVTKAARTPAPAGREAHPSVTPPASSMVIALVDRESRRAIPAAMIRLTPSQPLAERRPTGRITVAPRAKGPMAIVYNGLPVKFGEVGPLTRNGMTLTPFRHIVELSGGEVLWNNLIKQVKASSDGRRIEFTIGNPQALVNEQAVLMQAAPALIRDRAIVPVSFLRDALDVVVEYDPANRRITIAAK